MIMKITTIKITSSGNSVQNEIKRALICSCSDTLNMKQITLNERRQVHKNIVKDTQPAQSVVYTGWLKSSLFSMCFVYNVRKFYQLLARWKKNPLKNALQSNQKPTEAPSVFCFFLQGVHPSVMI